MRQTGPGGAASGAGGGSSIMGKHRGQRRRLPGPAAASYGTAWRSAHNPTVSAPDQPATDTDTLRRMHEQQRQRDANQFPAAAGGVGQQAGPCPVCHGTGQVDMSAQNAPMVAQCNQLIAQADAQVASLPDIVRDSQGNIIADNRALKARYRQAAAQARSQLASLPKTKPCDACGGTGHRR
jgi:hypothetical protein